MQVHAEMKKPKRASTKREDCPPIKRVKTSKNNIVEPVEEHDGKFCMIPKELVVCIFVCLHPPSLIHTRT